jgi:polysaccharide deacetylase
VKFVFVVVALSACGSAPADYDGIYSRVGDPITCALNIDDKNSVGVDALAAAMDRAQAEGLVLHLYAHQPGVTVDLSTIETVLSLADDRGLRFVTYDDLVDGSDGAGLALAFDDHDLDGWHALRPMFQRYHARLTFFISCYDSFDAPTKKQLRDLVADGHDIEYHSTKHRDAREFAEEHGVDAYMSQEIEPDLALMRADGFVPRVFAYPFGARNADTDDRLLGEFRVIRAIKSSCPR